MIADQMRERLLDLQPTRLDIIDESDQHHGHAGWREGGQTHFRIRMSSPAFAGQSRLARHRMVHNALGPLVTEIHALALELSDAAT